MPKKTAARSPRGREKSAPKQPTAQQYRALEQRQGELIALQRETLQQLAKALERISAVEEGLAAHLEVAACLRSVQSSGDSTLMVDPEPPAPRSWLRRLIGG